MELSVLEVAVARKDSPSNLVPDNLDKVVQEVLVVRVVLVDLVSLVVQLLPFLVVLSAPYSLVDPDCLANQVVPEGLVAHRCPVGLDTR